jgi:hypothetical protein
MNDVRAVPLEDGSAVQIQILEDPGYDSLVQAMREQRLGAFLDKVRGGKPISSIIDFTSEKHPRFIPWIFRGNDSDDQGRYKGDDYINPTKSRNRVDLYRRLSDKAKPGFLALLTPAIRKSLENALQEPTEMTRIGREKNLPQDVTRYTAEYLVGGRRKKTRKAKKSRKVKKTRSRRA